MICRLLVDRAMQLVLAAGAGIASVGCSVNVGASIVPPDDGDGAGQPIADTVTIVFRNLTADEAVEVEFHATADPLERLPDDLFDPANGYQVVRHIGVGGRGIIAPAEEDLVGLDCTDGLTIGTAGGRFVDNESGDEQGTGTARWIQEGGQFSCGAIVIFEFLRDGDEFKTNLLLGSEGP